MYSNTYFSVALAALFGLISYFFTAVSWFYIREYNPIIDWLIDNLTDAVWLQLSIYMNDFLINIVLAFPLALLINSLRPQKYILYLVVALLPTFVLLNRAWVMNSSFNELWPSIVAYWPQQLFCAPIALLIINSFKRNSLQPKL